MNSNDDGDMLASILSPEMVGNMPIPASFTFEDSIVAARTDTQTILDGIGPTNLATLGKLHTLAEPLVVRCCLSFLKRYVRFLISDAKPDFRRDAVTIGDNTYRLMAGRPPGKWRTLIIILGAIGFRPERTYMGCERQIEAVPQFDKAMMGVPETLRAFDTSAALRIVKSILETSYTWINARLTSAVSRSTGRVATRLYRRLGQSATRLHQDPQIIDEFLFGGSSLDNRVFHLLSKEKVQQSISRIATNAGTAQYSPTRLATEFAQCAVDLNVAHARFIPGELQSVSRSFSQTDYSESAPGLLEAELALHNSTDFSLIGINWKTGPRLWLLSPRRTASSATKLLQDSASSLVQDFLNCYADLPVVVTESTSGSAGDDVSQPTSEPNQESAQSVSPPREGWRTDSCDISPVHQELAEPVTITSLGQLPSIILAPTGEDERRDTDGASKEVQECRSAHQAILNNDGREWFTCRRLSAVSGRSVGQIRSKLDRMRRKHWKMSGENPPWRREMESSYESPSKPAGRPTLEYFIHSVWDGIWTLPERSQPNRR